MSDRAKADAKTSQIMISQNSSRRIRRLKLSQQMMTIDPEPIQLAQKTFRANKEQQHAQPDGKVNLN